MVGWPFCIESDTYKFTSQLKSIKDVIPQLNLPCLIMKNTLSLYLIEVISIGSQDLQAMEISSIWNLNIQNLCGISEITLKIALIPDSGKSIPGYDTLSQELKSDFIQDKERIIPNDQELTNWMKKHFNDHNDDSWYKIEFCKVFTNPKIIQESEKVWKTKYTVIVHYIDGDWDEFDV